MPFLSGAGPLENALNGSEGQLLIFTVLCLQAGFQFRDGLAGFDGSGTGNRTDNTGSGRLVLPLLTHIQTDFGLSFH